MLASMEFIGSCIYTSPYSVLYSVYTQEVIKKKDINHES